MGYGYEEGEISLNSESTIDEIFNNLKTQFYPNIYNVENIKRHDDYRLCRWGVKDHGIWGGKVFFQDMLKIKEILQQYNDKFR